MVTERANIDEWTLTRSDDFGGMSARTRNALRRAGMRTFDDLTLRRAEDLMTLRNFGAACCAEVIAVLREHGLRLAQAGDEANPPYTNQEPLPGRTLEERIAWLGTDQNAAALARREVLLDRAAKNAGLDAIASCAALVELELGRRRIDDEGVMDWGAAQSVAQRFSPKPRKISQLLRFLQYDPPARDRIESFESSLALSTIEEEVAALFETLDPRQATVIRGRCRLHDRVTLDELGAEFGVTRERARQIESEAHAQVQLRFRLRAMPRTRSGMALTGKARSLARVEKILCEHELVATAAGVGDFLLLWRAADSEDWPFPPIWVQEAKRGLTALQRRHAAEVIRNADKLVRQTGVVTEREILAALDRSRLETQDVTAILRDAGLHEVQAGVWLRRLGKAVPLSVATKMLSVCGPLTLRHIRRGLIRHQRRQGFPVRSTEVLKAALSIYHETILFKGELATPARTLRYSLGRAEQTWIDLVARSGPVVHADQVHAAFAEARLRSITASVLLANSEIVQRVRRSLYCLPGAVFTDVEIQKAREQAVRIDAASVMTFGEKGRIRFETTLQQYIAYGGSIAAGPAARLGGKWQLTISGREYGEFTVGAPWIFGLGAARDLLQLQPGDRILMEFDTWTRSADLVVRSRADGRKS
jgi:hypothetical protein